MILDENKEVFILAIRSNNDFGVMNMLMYVAVLEKSFDPRVASQGSASDNLSATLGWDLSLNELPNWTLILGMVYMCTNMHGAVLGEEVSRMTENVDK